MKFTRIKFGWPKFENRWPEPNEVAPLIAALAALLVILYNHWY